ncbi:hypothetical protein [Niabella hibiscisoli]|uniref:hypothetical protein n=1 Tax=Niabella hibiscisoli TaxID=1825928 RepID=UPI001F0E6597|nr:hypothetical protein [Niabella hibiscisoli]MCH5717949.1 hypothetical protein [Niabella hibiscisoli]
MPTKFGKVKNVSLLDNREKLSFVQNEQGLTVSLPTEHSGTQARVLKIEGLYLADQK